jgi:hypothetical protein
MPNPTVPVVMFNSNIYDLTTQVNNGASFVIPAASTTTFAPGTPTTEPTFSAGGPQTGVLGPGTNNLVVTPSQSIKGYSFEIVIPNIQIISLQFYFFWNGFNAVNWVVLNNGAVIGFGISGGSSTTHTVVHEHHEP